ncbi:MAG: helix-turn-helix transcriptional regulator [Syntrophomonadaceae bacterium]|nr:helix-turn-helix transcriptional regulator [Syntrophomonadaceae bacterium]
MNIGELIKSHRNKQNLSMNALARKADIAQSGLSDIEAGKRQPTFDLLEKIVNALNLTWSEFFKEVEPEISHELRSLLKNAKQLTPAEIDALNQFICIITEKKP